ncbi:MAG: metallophosphoesterase family protein [Solirubrobacteraceae bacterium]
MPNGYTFSMARALPRFALTVTVALLTLAAPAAAAPPASLPPAQGPGQLFAHYGEEHINDDDGPTLLPKVIAESTRFKPLLVTLSGDKANNGNLGELKLWQDAMNAYDRAGIPYFPGVGNHDRQGPPGAGGVTIPPLADLTPYKNFFAARPYPFGDAAPYSNPQISPRTRPASDPAGASSHYFVDAGNARWIFIDNSCFGIVNCDPFQSPSFPDAEGNDTQYEFLTSKAREASAQGKVVFVVMHMPTRDPGDQSYREPTAFNHVMGKGASPDNTQFEVVARQAGVDGVFLGYIKAQFLYRGEGDIPYYIDGGAGGELYTTGPVGTDHGYWHGFRLIRVDGPRITTDAVPIFNPGSIRIEGPATVSLETGARWEAFGSQPVFVNDAKVPRLELRDPKRAATTTPLAALPNPARIWTSDNPRVLAPLASATEDPRRDPSSQTQDGAFFGSCPGHTTLHVTSGFESKSLPVTVTSRPGRTMRRVFRGPTVLRSGRGGRVALVTLHQPAQVFVTVRRANRGRVRTLVNTCQQGISLDARWDGRVLLGGRLRAAPPGLYRIDVRVRSERGLGFRTRLVRVR